MREESLLLPVKQRKSFSKRSAVDGIIMSALYEAV